MIHDFVARTWIRMLDLRPHPEGGWFRETWRAEESVDADGLPARYGGGRSHGTAIYYLLAEGAFSAIHRIRSPEVWHHYAGDPVEMIQLSNDGSAVRLLLGPDVAHGELPQIVVPRGTWQGARIVPLGRRSLLGCSVAPGFEFEDFELGVREDLVARWPDLESEIVALTRPTADRTA